MSVQRLPRAVLTRLLMREFRGSGGRVLFFVLCLSVGVAAVVAVRAFSESLESGVRTKARELIAADFVVTGRGLAQRDLSSRWSELRTRSPQLERSEVWEAMSVAAAQREFLADNQTVPGIPIRGLTAVQQSQLVALKAVGEGYPYYGEVDTDPPLALEELFGEEGAVAALIAPDLAARLELEPGDAIVVAGSAFRVAGLVEAEPDRVGGSLAIAPRVLISQAGLERTGLRSGASRASFRVLFRLGDGTPLQPAVDEVERVLAGEFYEIETYREARPELRRALARVSAFLGLVALLSLLVGGVGVSQTVSAWLATRLDHIAIYKSLGLRPREVLRLFLGQVVVLSSLGSAVGAAVGAVVPLIVPVLFGDLVPSELVDPWQPAAVGIGFALGVLVALAFSLPPLLLVLRVPAARVLRRDSQPLRRSRRSGAFLICGLVAVLFAVATVQAVGMPVSAPVVGAGFTAAIVVCTGLLLLAARLLIALIERGRRRQPRVSAGAVAWRYGVAALARPGAGTLSAVVSLGLGLSVVLTMVLVERALTSRLQSELPRDAPSMFLMGIEEQQWPLIEPVLLGESAPALKSTSAGSTTEPGQVTPMNSAASASARRVRSVPVLMTEIISIDGESPSERLEQAREQGDDARQWATRRQLRVTPQRELPDGNSLVEGDWFVPDQIWEASFERDFAESLGVALGSNVRLRVGAEERELVVTSLRSVNWESFSINFFVVIEEGAFSDERVFRLATVRAGAEEEQSLQDQVIAIAPTVTVIRVRQALEKVLDIFQRAVFGVQFLGLFTAVAGLVILSGAVAATAARRGREAALLKALGLRRLQVALAFAVEYALIGLVAASIGVASAAAASYVAARWLLEVDWLFPPGPVALAAAAGLVLSVVGGLLASVGALRQRPIEALRAAD